jgi:hypothetical protein
LPKPGKPEGDPGSFRPICLLNTAGKLVEQIINNRMSLELKNGVDLAVTQYGFREGRSTLQAIERVVRVALEERQKPFKKRRFCAMITIDIKNAFNSASWKHNIVSEIQTRGVSKYLIRMVKSYFSDRCLEEEDGKNHNHYLWCTSRIRPGPSSVEHSLRRRS